MLENGRKIVVSLISHEHITQVFHLIRGRRKHSRPRAAGEDTDTSNATRACNRSRKSKRQVQRNAKNSLSWRLLRRWLSCKDQNDVQGEKKPNETTCSVSFCRMGNSPGVVKPEITTPESSKRLAATISLSTPSRSFRSPSKATSGAISTSFSSHSSASTTASVTSSSSSLGGSFKGRHLRKFSGCYECPVMADPTNGPSRDASMTATICPCPDCAELFMRSETLEVHQAICHADGNELVGFYSTACWCSFGLNKSTNLCQSIKHCNVCSIIGDGFKVDELGKIRTMATSGMAHDMAHASSDDEKRGMLVCRVIAGRVTKSQEAAEVFDSVTGVAGTYSNMDELFVFSPKAIFPCFVIQR
ncbi:C2H2 zinc finger protein [Musa troglodytarum]|uniref:C2H2 zinc finger protein n=2 Tax=Musa troglodytarum TaxID=320322 RepID=A0A9E7GGC4_9LILI|nr:C2H2 zinc finger protein [Musa troglodytarum]